MCKVLNRFACPYDSKIAITRDTVNYCSTEKPEVDYLFYLSELAFAVELALAKAQEEDSVFRIRGAADAYQVLTNREILEYRFLRIKFGEIISLSKFSIFI